MIEAYSVIDMFGPVYGRNWHAPEIEGAISFRWSGPKAESHLLAPSLGAARARIVFHLVRRPHPEHLDQIMVQVDGVAHPVLWTQNGSGLSFWVEFDREPGLPAFLSLTLHAPTSSEAQGPHRNVGVAVQQVEVIALSRSRAESSSAA